MPVSIVPSISPNVTHQPLPFHEVVLAESSPALTTVGLQAAGISLEAMGLRVGQRAFLTSCFTLLSYAHGDFASLVGWQKYRESCLSPPSKQFLVAASAAAPAPDKRISPLKLAYRSDLALLAPPVRSSLVPAPEVHVHEHHLRTPA